MSQIIINTGNIANDGTGDPLRTAFNDTNNNFTQIFSAGPVGSNISIANNTIQVTNTNGNLRLATNGIGVIVPATNIVPDIPNSRSLGTATNRFNTFYTQYLDSLNGTFAGNVYVGGNLFVTGTTVTVDYANANIGNLSLTLAGNSSNAVLSNGAGIIVNNANANILYNHSANTWNSTISVTAPAFIGDGSQLTNVNAVVNADNLVGNTLSSLVNSSNLTSFGSITDISGTGNISTTGNVYANIITGTQITANYLAGDGSNIYNIRANVLVGNVPFAQNANSSYTANLAALATQAINADTALFAINANLAAFANVATSAQTANSSRYAIQADNANSAVVAGTAYEISPNANISVTGNITTSGYFLGNGSQLTGIVAVANYSNANVANYLPIYSGNISNVNSVTTTGDINVGGIINLPMGQGYQYTAVLTGYGSNTAQVTFQLNCDQSGTQTEWQAGIDVAGTGYSVGQNWTYDSAFLGIPGASVTIQIGNVNGAGGVTNLEFTPPPLYPPSIVRQDGFIALEVDSLRWTFGLNGNLTLPNTASSINYPNGQPYNSPAGGANTQVQFNNDGILAGDSSFTYDSANIANGLQLISSFVANPGASILEVHGLSTYMGEVEGGGIEVNAATHTTIISTPNTTVNGNLSADGLYMGDVSFGTPGDYYFWANSSGISLGETAAQSISVDSTGINIGGTAGVNVYGVSGSNVNIGNPTGGNVYITNDVVSANSITAPTFYGDGGNLTGIYSNSNVATFLNDFGANSISTSGNVTANSITLKNTDDYPQILFSSDGGSTNNGEIKVDGGTNMAIRTTNNFYVNRAGQDRLAITDTNTDLSATNNVVIQSNKSASAYTWTFNNSGNLSAPGNITGSTFILSDAGSGTISTLQKNQNPPLGTEAFGIEMLTTLVDNPNVFSSISAGPDYVALQSTNAGNANITAQGGYGVTITTSNATGDAIQTWTFEEGGQTQFPGAITAVGNISGSYIIGDGGLLTNVAVSGSSPVSTTGNVSGGNIISTGTISASGNITALNFISNLANGGSKISIANNGNISLGVGPFGTTILSVNNTSGISVLGNIVGNGYVSVSGNITSNANVVTVAASGGNGIAINGAGIQAGTGVATILYDNSVFGWATNQGFHPTANTTQNLGRSNRYWNNLYSVNVNGVNQAMSGYVSAIGNVYGGNIIGNGVVSTTGNIQGSYILGNGSQLTGIVTTSSEPTFTIQSSNFNAGAGNRYGVNTTSGSVTATLPASPATGIAIFFADAGGAYATNNLIINPNGATIMGASGNMTVSTNNQSFGLFYNGTTWRTYNAG